MTCKSSKPSYFVISLDFELFWGVLESSTIPSYGSNIRGVREAIPAMLELFRRYDIHTTWATVGMLMCKDFKQWHQIKPRVLPQYIRNEISPYSYSDIVKDNEDLFFARDLVEQIQATPMQEIATHTYSHFYCSEPGANVEQFKADIEVAIQIAKEMGIKLKSIVFPRNQVLKPFLDVLPDYGIGSYRGNPDQWIYRNGHFAPGGKAGRAVRFADAWIPFSGENTFNVDTDSFPVNIPASMFLRPWSSKFSKLDSLKLRRILNAMNSAVETGESFHLWWHPHNFGKNLDQNLGLLELVLKHYETLRSQGMESKTMSEIAESLN